MNQIPVTKVFLPPLEEYNQQLKRAWDASWITNRGILVRELEELLVNYLSLKQAQVLATNNGTIPIQIALRWCGKEGEVITTPFSYVATTSAIVWEHCTPIFVDIHPEYLTIDETKIEASITSKTTAILATHVYGNPCNVEEIERIAARYNLKVIYDAAHCFGVDYNGRSIFEYGDISTCSFHATKLFHTGEGGAIFCKDKEVMQKLYYLHNFGHNGPVEFVGLGINAKMSELQAALGLSVLPHLQAIIESRKDAVRFYDENIDFKRFRKMKVREGTVWNYSYYPILFDSEENLLFIQELMNNAGIFPRRYFYPSLNNLPYLEKVTMPITDEVAKKVLCLPLFAGITTGDLERITQILERII